MPAEQSWRVDLEAVGYVHMYFHRGNLPQQGLKANSGKEKYEKSMQKKMSAPVRLSHTQRTAVAGGSRTVPDHVLLHRLMKGLFFREGFQYVKKGPITNRRPPTTSQMFGVGGLLSVAGSRPSMTVFDWTIVNSQRE